MPSSDPTFFTFVKEGFLYHWNLLVVGAAAGVAYLSGRADVVVPLAAAAEIAYLSYLCTRPRFQDAIKAKYREQERKEVRREASSSQQKMRVSTMINALDRPTRERYQKLQERCSNILSVTGGLNTEGDDSFADLYGTQISGINRLLWVYLKLLYTSVNIDQLVTQIKVDEIERSIAETQEKLKALPADPSKDRMRKSLEDILATTNMRLTNYHLARDNQQFIELETKRIEEKIAALAETAINRQDARFITSEVDSVASSMQATERTMSDLKLLTGIDVDDAAPELITPQQRENA